MALPNVVAWAQAPRFSIGPEFNFRKETLRFDDPNRRLDRNMENRRLVLGVAGRWYAIDKLTSELSLLHNFTTDPAIVVDNQPFFWRSTPKRDWQINLRQYYHPFRVNMGRRSQVLLGIHGGVSYMRHNQSAVGGGFQQIDVNGIEYFQRSSGFFERGHTLSLESGVNVHYFVGTRWHFRYNYTWLWGAGVTGRTNVTYSSTNRPEAQASITSNGTGTMWGLSVGYCFGGSNVAFYEKQR